MTRPVPPSSPPSGDWIGIRKASRPTLWAYGTGVLVGADLAGWLPESPATGIALVSLLTLALAKEVVHRDR
ncbi:hypothetical protein ACWDUC_37545 [Streptomyces tricolor]